MSKQRVEQSLSRLSVERIQRDLLRMVYGNLDTVIARTDPRVLIGVYTFYALAPWFTHNQTILLGWLLLTTIAAFAARVSRIVLVLLGLGIASHIVGYGIFALIMGGDWQVFRVLSPLVLKLTVVSMASIAAFASMDPERFSDALVSLGIGGRIAFGIGYAYRIVPVLLREYINIVHSYRLRSRAPERGRFFWIRYGFYLLRLAVRSFYPMMLNTAKRTRTTVEGLEIRGFTYSLENPEAKRLKLAYLRIGTHDIAFLILSAASTFLVLLFGWRFPL